VHRESNLIIVQQDATYIHGSVHRESNLIIVQQDATYIHGSVHRESNLINVQQYETYIHGSVHRESNLIISQKDATVFSLLHFCMQLYMFRVLTPINRNWYSCNYSFWY